MPAKPEDLYGTFGSVPTTPSEGGGPVPFSARATPNDMGAQVGEAISKAGDVGNELAVKYQGMVNETLATNAETEYTEKLGALTGDFKSKEGLEAATALPKYTSDVANLRQQYRAQLPMAAAHSFDMLALRHEGFAIGDANTYVAAQTRAADYGSANKAYANAITMAGNTGGDDRQFGMIKGDMISHLTRMNQDAPGFLGQDKSTGEPVFDDTAGGKASKATYEQNLSAGLSQAWVNRYTPMMDMDIGGAWNKYQRDRDQIPPLGQVALDSAFKPRVQTAQVNGITEGTMQKVAQDHQQALLNPSSVGSDAFNLGNVKTAAGAAQGTADFIHPATAVDGVTFTANNIRKNYQGMTLAQIGPKWTGEPDKAADWIKNASAASGIDPNAPINLDDPTTLASLMKGIGAAEKSTTDRANFTDDVINKGVQNSLSGVEPKQSDAVKSYATNEHGAPLNQADYIRQNYAAIIQHGQEWAEQQHPGNVNFANQNRAALESRLNDVIRQQEMSYKVDSDMVLTAANGTMSNGKKPSSLEELEAISPDVKEALGRMSVDSPQAYEALSNRILTANSRGTNKYNVKYGDAGVEALGKIARGEITNSAELMALYGADDNKDLQKYTPDFLEEAEKMLKEDPDQAKDMQAALDSVKAKFALHFKKYDMMDPEGKIGYAAAEPALRKAWRDGIAKKIPASELSDPESKNYIGLAVKGDWISKDQQAINYIKNNPTGLDKPVDNSLPDTASPKEFAQAYSSEADPVKKEAIKQRALKLFPWLHDDQAPQAPISK